MLPPLDFPEPSLMVAIEPQSKGDLDKMGPALARMLEEEPTVRLERSATGEQVLRTMGEAHTAVIIERLKRKFGAAIATHTPKVPYKETIRGKTQVHGRYKKQTGGHGMFGDVWLELEPNPDGGVEFAERVVGGSVPKGFFAGVEKGIREAAEGGVIAGYPLSDFRATLYDGSFHPVDSNELSFKIAASMALKDGVHNAKPALLEPIMAVEIRVPEAYMGEVNRDLNGRRGRVLGMDTDGDMQVITAHVPQAELFNYATELRSLAQGRGSFTATLDHYEDVPGPHRREGDRRPPQGARGGRRARRALSDVTSAAALMRRHRVSNRPVIERPADDRAAASDRHGRARMSSSDRDAAGRDDRAAIELDEPLVEREVRARRAGRRARWRSPRRSRRRRRPVAGSRRRHRRPRRRSSSPARRPGRPARRSRRRSARLRVPSTRRPAKRCILERRRADDDSRGAARERPRRRRLRRAGRRRLRR